MDTASFEYRKKDRETPFETFLQYSNERVQSATKSAAAVRQILPASSSVLDVGTGDGEYPELALTKAGVPDLTLTLVEPSAELFKQLESRLKQSFSGRRPQVVRSDLQGFEIDEAFDLILVSHLFYHLPRSRQHLSAAGWHRSSRAEVGAPTPVKLIDKICKLC